MTLENIKLHNRLVMERFVEELQDMPVQRPEVKSALIASVAVALSKATIEGFDSESPFEELFGLGLDREYILRFGAGSF